MKLTILSINNIYNSEYYSLFKSFSNNNIELMLYISTNIIIFLISIISIVYTL